MKSICRFWKELTFDGKLIMIAGGLAIAATITLIIGKIRQHAASP